MQQTTYGQNVSGGGAMASLPRPQARWRRALAWSPLWLFAALALAAGADLVADLLAGASPKHVFVEALIFALSLCSVLFIWSQMRTAQARAVDLERDLVGTRADLSRWRDEAQDHLRGLGVAIDRQFERWDLTIAEGEVAVLLLKGLSLKDVAAIRSTSERTVRQQSLAIYRKAGLAGRAELAAFFLEDLLLPAPSRRRGE
jgi:DNA-binding CsgD family transcriptional regulator